VVDPAGREATDQVFFGATVTVQDEAGATDSYAIVGIDEADPARGRISWISPLARALLKAREGEAVRCQIPGGTRELEILSVRYLALD
jgi:transcription elongation factor GreB